MIRKRTVLLILFVVISAVALGVITLKTEVLNRILRPFFEQKLGVVYKAKVDIGAIDGGIWNGFTLKRVRFTWPSANLIRSLAAAKIQTNIHMLDWIGQETSLRRSLLLNGTTFRLQKSLRIQMSPIMDYVEKVPEVENRIRNLATDSLWLDGDSLVLQNMPKQVFMLGTVFVHMNTSKDGKESELRIFGMKPNDKEAKRFYLVEHLLHEPGEGSARFKIAGYPLKELDGLNPNIRIYSGLLKMGGVIKSGTLEEGYVEIIDFEAGFRGPDDVVQRGKFDANLRYANNTVFIEKFSLIGEDVGFQVEGTIKNPAKKLKMDMDLAAKGKVGNKILEFALKGKLKKPQVNGHFILNDEKGNPKLVVGLEGFFKKLKLRTQNMGLLGLNGKVFWGKNKEDLGKRKEKALEFSGDIFAGIDGLSLKNIEVRLLEDQIMVKGNVFPDKTLLNIMVKECMLGRFSLHGEAVLEVDSALFAQSEGWPMKFRIPWFAVNGVDVEEINAQVQYFPDEKYLKIESFQMGKGCEVKGWMDFQKNTLDLVGDFNEFRLKTFFS
ncbi:MAG: hypothetical protein P9M03_01585 [Candidatus Theseobacter exili]|nr:hypothetical protein [Candidatus Theseobacter exili]